MRGFEETQKNIERLKKISSLARPVLELPNLSDKIVCFIAEWERGGFEERLSKPEYENNDYIINEKKLFAIIRKNLLSKGMLSFMAYREFKDDFRKKEAMEDRDELSIMIDKIRDNFVKTDQQKAYFDLEMTRSKLIESDIHILPEDVYSDQFIEYEEKTIDSKKVNILCVDYSTFDDSVLLAFLKYFEKIFRKDDPDFYIRPDSAALFKLFADVSINIKFDYMVGLTEILLASPEYPLTTDEWDEIEYLSSNHLQHIATPSFWHDNLSETHGYLCKYNSDSTMSKQAQDVKGDFRFFYSFQSLLCWELVNILKKPGRCKNCGLPLSSDRKASKIYCDDLTCKKAVNKLKQQKHYNKNHKK